jgi:hypothetical protein
MSIETIKLRDYEKLPIIYDKDGEINEHPTMKIGDIYLIREPEKFPEVGDVISVYKIINVTEYSNESKIEMLRIE